MSGNSQDATGVDVGRPGRPQSPSSLAWTHQVYRILRENDGETATTGHPVLISNVVGKAVDPSGHSYLLFKYEDQGAGSDEYLSNYMFYPNSNLEKISKIPKQQSRFMLSDYSWDKAFQGICSGAAGVFRDMSASSTRPNVPTLEYRAGSFCAYFLQTHLDGMVTEAEGGSTLPIQVRYLDREQWDKAKTDRTVDADALEPPSEGLVMGLVDTYNATSAILSDA